MSTKINRAFAAWIVVFAAILTVPSAYAGDYVIDGNLVVNSNTTMSDLVITTNGGGIDMSGNELENVSVIKFDPIRYQNSWFDPMYSWATNRLSVVNVHEFYDWLSGTRGSNMQSLQFDGQLLATTPLDNPYFMYLDTIVGLGVELGTNECIGVDDFTGDPYVLPYISGGYIKLIATHYGGYFVDNTATLQISGNIPNEIDVFGHFDMQGNYISNAVFVGDGSGLTNLPVTGLDTDTADARYVKKLGDTITGPLLVDAPATQTNLVVNGWAQIACIPPLGDLSMGTFTNGLPQ